MEHLTRWTVLSLFVFLLITSCTPGRMMTRDSDMNENDQLYKQDEEFSYRDDSHQKNDDYDEYSAPDGFKRHSYADADMDRDSSRFEVNKDRNIRTKHGRYYQKGLASWYGREFQDSITASGERFDMYKLTAAHRTLPFGTLLLVRNLENGRSVRVKINDRGPYRDNRILDLSYAAAKNLNIIKKGEAKVGIEILKRGEVAQNSRGEQRNREKLDDYTTKGVSDFSLKRPDEKDEYRNEYTDEYLDRDNYGSGGEYSIQAGAFYSRRNANRVKDRLKVIVENPVVIFQDGDMYKVRIEGFHSKRDAIRIKKELLSEDISSYIVKTR